MLSYESREFFFYFLTIIGFEDLAELGSADYL